ncbi:MAG: rod shape-determining protein MreC [Candidatus Staskawiczbacteria bacterium RIFOXYC1_FULL_38_18]|uniref:Cell shape-determining protein MreC n=1 Tax=Candidatus Staskawiczbacteria bacterium RIFOXYC1_FULL_38_18 TaxID=1802229 RepID=A0A1G2JA25_9BACT|nr:MAG: rod shape-determining protein MreC [Candidatus Staskawiczbacteria bacterium RIFOXYC1_FULL_38_18]
MNTLSENFSINKKNNNILKYFGVIITLIFFIIIFNFFGSQIKNSFYVVSSPVEKVFWSAGESSSGFLSSFFWAGAIAKENDNLKGENEKLIAQVVLLQAVNNANQAQSDISLGIQNADLKLLMAGIIGLAGQDVVSVNKGSDDGIEEGMPVISQQNVVLGKINKVYKNFSSVMLISNKNSVVNVKVRQNKGGEIMPDTETEIDGVIRGSGNSGVSLDLIPVDKNINEGDILITSSLEEVFPKNLLIGKITKIQKNDQKPFQQAEIQPFFDLKGLDNLFVITNYKR